MIASLAMYDWPGQSPHWDRFWAEIAKALVSFGINAPVGLTRGGSLWDHWQDPTLVLGQTCGMPYRTRLHDKVQLIGALDHGLKDAPAGYYYSKLVVHRDVSGGLTDFADKTLAYNGLDSESGWAAAQNTALDRGFSFTRMLHTGSHRKSALAVSEGRADIAAIDAETFRLIERHMPETARDLRVLTTSVPTPGLPLICALGVDAKAVAQALLTALDTTPLDVLEALHIKGFVPIPASDYLSVRTPAIPSQDAPAA